MGEMLLQVAQLRAENSTLLQRLQEITYMHKDASVDNRILKADVEALRAKVFVHFLRFYFQAICRLSWVNRPQSNLSLGLMNAISGSHVKRDSSHSLRCIGVQVKMTEGMVAQQGQPMVNFIPDSNLSFISPIMISERPLPQQMRHSSMMRYDQQQQHPCSIGGKIWRSPSMQRIAGLEHMRVRNGSSCNTAAWGGWEMDKPAIVQGHGI